MTLSRVYNSQLEYDAEKALHEILILIREQQHAASQIMLDEDHCYKNSPTAGPTPHQIDTIPGLKEAWERVIILQQLGK